MIFLYIMKIIYGVLFVLVVLVLLMVKEVLIWDVFCDLDDVSDVYFEIVLRRKCNVVFVVELFVGCCN